MVFRYSFRELSGLRYTFRKRPQSLHPRGKHWQPWSAFCDRGVFQSGWKQFTSYNDKKKRRSHGIHLQCGWSQSSKSDLLTGEHHLWPKCVSSMDSTDFEGNASGWKEIHSGLLSVLDESSVKIGWIESSWKQRRGRNLLEFGRENR